ncbi:MAG: phosphate transport system protein [Pseudohongiellaceae bacterium]|jgi:phosphate transport system protein
MLNDIIQLLKRDNLMVQALDECYEMVDICSSMLDACVESLRRRDDASIELDVHKLDKKLNAFERDVRRKVMTHLAVGGKQDLTSGLVLVSIVIDLERIGDYAKNIYDLVIAHPTRLVAGSIEPQLAEVEALAMGNFHRAVHVFKTSDVEAAKELMADYKSEISSACRAIEEALIAGEADLSASEAVVVALYVRFLKRISSHARNLVSSITNPFPRIGYKVKDS